MIKNEFPSEPFYDAADWDQFYLINNIDRDRQDLRDPIDIVAELEFHIGCPLAQN